MTGNSRRSSRTTSHSSPCDPTSPSQPSVVVLPVPKPYATQRIADDGDRHSRCRTRSALRRLAGAARAAGRSRSRKTTGRKRCRSSRSHLHPVPAVRELRTRRHACRTSTRSKRAGPAPAGRRPIVPQSRRGRGVARRARRDRAARRRAVGVCDAAGSVLRDRRRGAAAVPTSARTLHPFTCPSSWIPARPPTSAPRRCGRSPTRWRSCGRFTSGGTASPSRRRSDALLETTRVHVRFALEHGGEQVLANVLRVADLARQFEAEGGMSFRGFLEELDDAGRDRTGGGSADPRGRQRRRPTDDRPQGQGPRVPGRDPRRHDGEAAAGEPEPLSRSDRRLCAIRLAGCMPADLTIQRRPIELEREEAEGVRIAYVAATRARDLLVVPAVGDEERDGWLETLNSAIFPASISGGHRPPRRAVPVPIEGLRAAAAARRSGGSATVCPGLHRIGVTTSCGGHPLELASRCGAAGRPPACGSHREGRGGRGGARRDSPSTAPGSAARANAIESGSTAEPRRADGDAPCASPAAATTPRLRTSSSRPALAPRPTGRRFGTLVHSVLASAPLDADAGAIRGLAASYGRTLGATTREVESAVERVVAAFGHPLFARVRRRRPPAAAAAKCRRLADGRRIAARRGRRPGVRGIERLDSRRFQDR